MRKGKQGLGSLSQSSDFTMKNGITRRPETTVYRSNVHIGFSESDMKSNNDFRSLASSNKANCFVPKINVAKLYDDVIVEMIEPDSVLLNPNQQRDASGVKLDMEDYMRMRIDSDSSLEATPRD